MTGALTGALSGYEFRRPALLQEALTHRSAIPRRDRGPSTIRSNERLEYLGDRVLNLLIAEWLSERYPAQPEGMLARRQSELQAEPQLAAIGQELGLQDVLIVGANEARAGVAQGAAVLADAMEAILGALFLDGGLDPARALVRSAWAAAFDRQDTPSKHPKSDLKEWLEARGHVLPPFTVQDRTGPDHAFTFTITVSALGRTGQGVASTKHMAERNAAADLLEQLQSSPQKSAP